MRLARVFGDYMVLQRGMRVPVWGTSERAQAIEVRLNGEKIREAKVPEGEFCVLLPALEAMEDATLEVGDVRLEHVDVGEVWVAGGQSNMEFMLEYTAGGEEEVAAADDPHLRMYTVGQYTFAGERELGYKAWNPWDCWLAYAPDTAGPMSAVGVHFARELRESGVPVGILNCSYGGTSASAWMDPELLRQSPALKRYLDEFDALVAALDLPRYERIKSFVRPAMASPQGRAGMALILKNTFAPATMMQQVAAMAGGAGGASGEAGAQEAAAQMPEELREIAALPKEEIMATGPGDANEPGALWANMLSEIAGYGARGVIWYQGETDEGKAPLYAELFAALAGCWRREWAARCPDAADLPFVCAQLAPFGTWMGNNGSNFPELREQQVRAAREVPGVWLASTSDVGNVYDIHSKVKAPVGRRLASRPQARLWREGPRGRRARGGVARGRGRCGTGLLPVRGGPRGPARGLLVLQRLRGGGHSAGASTAGIRWRQRAGTRGGRLSRPG